MNREIPWKAILEVAKNAPSGGNIQPWSVSQQNDSLLVFAQVVAIPDITSFDRLAAFVSIGALGYNIALVAQGLGYIVAITVIDDNLQQPFLKIDITGFDKASENINLIAMVKDRCTNRKASIGKIPEIIINNLYQNFYANTTLFGSSFMQIKLTRDAEQMEEISRILAAAEILRFSNKQTRNKVFTELKCSENYVMNKISLKTLELSWFLEKLFCLMIRVPSLQWMPSSTLIGSIARKQLLDSSDIGCIFSDKKLSYADLIEFGRVLQAFWLQVTRYGYYIQPWTSLTFYGLETSMSNKLTFSQEQRKVIEGMLNQLNGVYGMSGSIPVFVFRMLDAPRPKFISLKQEISISQTDRSL